MTDEEKTMEEWTVTQEEAEAEMYADEKHCSKCINFGYCVEIAIEDRCKVYRESYTDYLNGLTKGRKENAELKKSIEKYVSGYEHIISSYKKQIEKMKFDIKIEAERNAYISQATLNHLLEQWEKTE